jgi:CBS domain-containing protein
VARVKRFVSGIVYNPITLRPDQTLADARVLMERYRVTGFPVVDERGFVLGIVTNRDMRFAEDDATPVRVMMTSDNLAMLAEPGVAPQIVRSGETSLEGLTRELLRPALAEWLDKNLPPLVERMVAAEIARIVGKKG